MKLRKLLSGVCLMSLLAVPAVTFGKGGGGMNYGGGGAAPKPIVIEQVLRFVSSGEAMYMGHKDTYVVFAPLNGTQTVQAWVPFKDKTTEPDNAIAGPIANYKAGDVLHVYLDKVNNYLTIKSLKMVDVKPGEENPHGYVFQETYTEQGTSNPLVRFTKYGQDVEMALPKVKGAKGQMETDPAMDDAVSKFKSGDVVYVQMTAGSPRPVLSGIYPYKEPETGKVTKVSEQMIDNQKAPDVELTSADGKAVTALVPGKTVSKRWVPDATIMRTVRSLKPGAEVLYMTHVDNDKTYLIDISKALPAPKAEKEKQTTMAKEK